MILPTKRITEEHSLIGIGGKVLSFLSEPKTVSRLWNSLKSSYEEKSGDHTITFEWFVLSLDLLFIMNTIQFTNGLIRKTTHDK